MTDIKSLIGGKRRGRGRKSGRRSRQNQNQQNGGNSSSTAAGYAGLVPMAKYNGGGLDGSDYNNNATPLISGNATVGGLSIPTLKGGNAGLSIPSMDMTKGGNASVAGLSIPTLTGGSTEPVQIKGGNVLNNLAVPAVLLYANNTFGKKRSSGKSTKNRRFRRNRGRKTNRRNR